MNRDAIKCKKCDVTLRMSFAIAQTWGASKGDRLDSHSRTLWPAGPGKLVRCLKCPSCGYSVTPGAPNEPENVAP